MSEPVRLTPTQDLVLEVLIARQRLGHHIWTFEANSPVGRALKELEAKGLVGWKGGVAQGTYLAWLTEKGKALYLPDGYVPPIAGGQP